MILNFGKNLYPVKTVYAWYNISHNNISRTLCRSPACQNQVPIYPYCIMLLKFVQLINPMFCRFNTSLILAAEKYSLWNQSMLCTNVKLSSDCSQSLTLMT